MRSSSTNLSCDRYERPSVVRMMYIRTTHLLSLGVTNRPCGLSSHSMSTIRMCRMDHEWDPMLGPMFRALET